MLSRMQLEEPVIAATIAVLETNLPAVIDSLNATIADGYTVDHPAQYLPFAPIAQTLEAGTPALGVAELGMGFADDLVFDVDADHTIAVVIAIQNADYPTLAWQLRRSLQAIAITLQQDRVLGPGHSVLEQQGGLWGVRFVRTEPGPLLPEIDPTSPGLPPRGWISWTGLLFEGRRKEVNAGG